MDDELAGCVGSSLFNAGFDGFFLGLEGGEVFFALALQVPAVASGWYNVITDSAAFPGDRSRRTVKEEAQNREVDPNGLPVDSETVPDQAVVGQLVGVSLGQVGEPAKGDGEGSAVLEFDHERSFGDHDGSGS